MQDDPMVARFGLPGASKSIADAIRNTNPLYDPSNPDYSENCQRVIFAYEARRRGFNVSATAWVPGDDAMTWIGARMPGLYERLWEGVVTVGSQRVKAGISKIVNTWPDGARGIVVVAGHAFNVERTVSRVRFVDAQARRSVVAAANFTRGVVVPAQIAPKGRAIRAFVARVDDLPFTDAVLVAVTMGS